MKKLFVFLIMIFLVGCSSNISNETNYESKDSLDVSSNSQVIQDRYKFDDYNMMLLNEQKKSSAISKKIINNMANYEKAFSSHKFRISDKYRINIIPYSMTYSKKDELYVIEVFVINKSNSVINDLSFMIQTVFKNKIEGQNVFDVEFSQQQLGNFKPNDMFIVSITGSVSLDQLSELEKNTADDINIEVLDLSINKEQISNDK